MPEYPESEKMHAVHEQSQQIGEFLDWLGQQGMRVCELQTEVACEWRSLVHELHCEQGQVMDPDGPLDEDCKQCHGTGMVELVTPQYHPTRLSIEKLLAQFYEIDLDKIEAERRAMLDSLRAAS